jgi:hypothetical protein
MDKEPYHLGDTLVLITSVIIRIILIVAQL